MTNAEAVNWLINITADIGKAEHSDLWHYEQALSEIREMLEDAQSRHYHEENLLTYAHDMGVTLEQAKKELQKVTEQPETHDKRTEKHACDLIDRQAAIAHAVPLNLFGREVMMVSVSELENLPSAQPERKKPVFKTGESVYHVSYADGTGGFEKNKWADWTCPDCGWFVGEQYIPRRHNQQKCNYCARCGCAIDWSDADMRGEQDD